MHRRRETGDGRRTNRAVAVSGEVGQGQVGQVAEALAHAVRPARVLHRLVGGVSGVVSGRHGVPVAGRHAGIPGGGGGLGVTSAPAEFVSITIPTAR